MHDALQRFLLEHTCVRGELVHLDATWRAVLERHEYPAALQSVLGELMAAAGLLSSTLKFSGSLILQIHGNGPVRLIVVECTSEQTMRATAKWEGNPEGTFKELVGEGRFAITIAQEDSKQNYQGIAGLDGSCVAEVLEHYMATSEQLETRLCLASNRERSAGLMLQRMPGTYLSEDAEAWNRATQLARTITAAELLSLPKTQILRRLYHQKDVRVFEPKIMSFGCSCTRERVANMLRMLGAAEVQSILSEREEVDVHCEFCNRRYAFDRVDAEQVFAAEHLAGPRGTRH
ncbi:MAG: Hsp33 family molecular chaperone HslO [Betaproteobacteria bacterium]|nr:Hsp33 family molecular chaperone HslO [Betaproteobacteria bacterium]